MSMKYFFRDQETLSKFRLHPLGDYLNSYARQLHSQGYYRETGRGKIRMIAHFGLWLKQKGIAAKGLSEKEVKKYLRAKVRNGRHLTDGDALALKQFMEFLRGKGAIAEKPMPRIEMTPIDEMENDYALYLKKERALSSRTIADYRRHVRRFLDDSFSKAALDLSALSSKSIFSHVRREAPKASRKYAKSMTTALRSFLQYARFQGYIDTDLAAAVPAVANWATISIPRAIPRDQVKKVLACCDRQTRMGQRDYAVLLILARLGLRAGEIVSMQLEDIDWNTGCLTVHGKGSNLEQMPMPADVGKAIAVYLRKGRPKSSSRAVFLTTVGPIRGLVGPSAISNIVSRALKRAGIDTKRKGAHQFRHGLATELLKAGASLPQIAELLRHRTVQCTKMYATVDFPSLRPLAMPWPGGAQ
jgi:integrase/recombinase XerD